MERMKHTGDYELDEINMLEQECADLEEDNKRLEQENKSLKEENRKLSEGKIIYASEKEQRHYVDILEENRKLKEFKEKREESMFYFKAIMERTEPKTAKESEDLQKAKNIFEKLYNEKLDSLKEENRKLKLHIEAKDKAYTALLRDYEELKLESKK